MLFSTAQHFGIPLSPKVSGVGVLALLSPVASIVAAQNHVKVTNLEPTLHLLTFMHCGCEEIPLTYVIKWQLSVI